MLYSGIQTLSSRTPPPPPHPCHLWKGMGRVKLLFRQDLSESPVKNGLENDENGRKTGERTRPYKQKFLEDVL